MSNPVAIDTAAEILRGGAWFQTLSTTIQQQIIDAGAFRMFSPAQRLFTSGDGPSGLHAVLTGEVHVGGTSMGGNDVIMAIIRPAEWTGFLACLDGGPHLYSAVAVTAATIFCLSPAAVAAIFETDVATYRLLQAPELSAARKLSHFVIEDMGLPLAQRVASRLADLGRWAYGPATGPVAVLDHVSQEELAMSVHASRQKVNMILRDLAAQNLIEIGYGRIRVLDSAALDAFARDATPRKLSR